MKKTLYLLLLFLCLSLYGCESSSGNDSITITNDKEDAGQGTDDTEGTGQEIDDTENAEQEINDAESDDTDSISEKDIEVVGEYSYTNMLANTHYFLVVKNNSKKTLQINSAAVAYDKKGEEIGAADGSFEDLPSGCEALITHYFESTKNIKNFKYELEVKEEEYYQPAIQDVKVTTKNWMTR